jgi:hypothetical protein
LREFGIRGAGRNEIVSLCPHCTLSAQAFDRGYTPT